MANPRIAAKQKAIEDMLEWASKASAKTLRGKYGPKPKAPEPKPEAPPEEPLDYEALESLVKD